MQSPLLTLQILGAPNKDLSPEDRSLSAAAISRIEEIAEDLLKLYRKCESDSHIESDLHPNSLKSLIDPIVKEKTLELRKKNSKIELSVKGLVESEKVTIWSNRSDFQRLLSNIINNAIEAIKGSGKVELQIEREKRNIRILVKDTGIGIPKTLLTELGKRGHSVGKKGGSGLGLFHARKCVEDWHGSIRFDSAEGKGTCVVLSFPEAGPLHAI